MTYYLVARVQGHPREKSVVDWRKYTVAEDLTTAFRLLREEHQIENSARLAAGVWRLMQDPKHVPCTSVVRGVAPGSVFSQYRDGEPPFYNPDFSTKLLIPYEGEETIA